MTRLPRYSLLSLLLVLLLAACSSTASTQQNTATRTSVVTPSPTSAKPIAQLAAPVVTYKGHAGAVIGIAWSLDGKQIASASDDGTVQLWSAATGKRAWAYTYAAGGPKYLFAVAWSPDGRFIAAGGQGGAVVILNAATGHFVTAYYSYSAAIEGIAWSPDSKRLAFGLQGDNSVRVWDIASKKQIIDYTGHTDSVNRVAWSPDGTEIAAASYDGTVQVVNAASGQRLLTYNVGTPLWSIAWSPDGKQIVTGTGAAGMDYPVSSGNAVKVFDATTNRTLLTYTGHGGNVYAASWSPNGQYIASGGDDKTVRIWNAATGQTLLIGKGFTDIVWDTAWSPDGKELAACSQDGTVQVWHISL